MTAYVTPDHTVMVDGLLRPDRAATKRTFIQGIAKIVTGQRTYFLRDGLRLYQTPSFYEIRDEFYLGLENEIELDKVLWVEPEEKPGYYDFDKNQFLYYDEQAG
jgi:hypothetical protein